MTQKHYIAPKKGKTKFSHFQMKQEVLQLLESENLRKPTVVQAQSLPITLQENLKELCTIIYAYNGAGKTLTFFIPVLNSLEMLPFTSTSNFRGKQTIKWRPQAIIVLPTEALMSQIYDYLDGYANFYQSTFKWPLKIGKAYGKQCIPGHIIVGMTDRVSKLIDGFDLSELKWVVFDECDKIKDDSQAFFKQILGIFQKHQTSTNFLITSATGEKKSFRNFIQDHLKTHNILQLDSKDQNQGLKGVYHYYSDKTGKDKDESILSILGELAGKDSKIQVIIFFNHIKQLRSFYQTLTKQTEKFVVNDAEADSKGKNNLNIDFIHSKSNGICRGQHSCPLDCKRTKTQRVARLRNGQIQVLLGTQTIGRGIDIRTVSLVINYSQPLKNQEQMSSIAYIHRVGRTGRHSDQGVALTYLDTASQQFVKMVQIQQKVQFKKMPSESEILSQALIYSKKNTEIAEDGKHRYQA